MCAGAGIQAYGCAKGVAEAPWLVFTMRSQKSTVTFILPVIQYALGSRQLQRRPTLGVDAKVTDSGQGEPPDMAPTLPQFNPARLRAYVFRLPLFTRIVILLIILFWILGFQTAWDVAQWGALVPSQVSLSTSTSTSAEGPNRTKPSLNRQTNLFNCLVYRLNTYPLIHLGFLHTVLNTLALAPLLERFEADHGTLLTAAMFVGRKYTPSRSMELIYLSHQLFLALSTLPAAAYLLIERGLLRRNTTVLGARCGDKAYTKSWIDHR